jgi:putative ABC transport system permease protein
MPERFVFPPRGAALNGDPADVFIPMSFTPFERQAFGMMYSNTVVARLKPRVSIDQARAELSTLIQPLADRYPGALQQIAARQSIPIVPMAEETVGSSRRLLWLMMGAVALVLLIACADVAGLILTRSAARGRELAIRSSLGATSGRIVQLLAEAFVLAGVGCVSGVLVAYALMRGVLSVAGERLPRADAIAFDYRIVLFALALAVVTPLLFGIIPALRATRVTGGHVMTQSARGGTSRRLSGRLLGSLVVVQFAVALMLAVAAGLLVRSFVRLAQTDPGFRPDQTVGATVTLPAGRYTPEQVRAFYRQSIDELRSVPGLVSIGAGSDLPLGVRERRAFSTDPSGQPIPEPSRFLAPTWTAGAYFDALGIPLRHGRFFNDADGPFSQQVVVVNERFARLVWPDTDPLGRQLRWGLDTPNNQSPWMTVVGVVGDVKEAGLDTPAIAQVYVPLAQDATVGNLLRTANLVVRSSRDPQSVMVDVRRIIERLDNALPVTSQTLDDMVGRAVQPQRFSMSVMALFAGVALVLAALGIYGVLANAVAQQTRDIGVRVALGATRSVVIWMVLRQALMLALIGIVLGTAGALAATQMMASLLFDVRPRDAVSFVGAVGTLALVALVASLAPALRAIKVDPIVALRAD